MGGWRVTTSELSMIFTLAYKSRDLGLDCYFK